MAPLPPRREGRAAKLVREAAAMLAAQGIDSARLDAEVMLAHCLGSTRRALLVAIAGGRDLDIDPPTGALFAALVKRRAAREPVAYITGRREFWSLEFEVTPAVLIPRPETEHVVSAALSLLPRAPAGPVRFVDVGTGSGAIAVSILRERTDALAVAVDASEAALHVARRNARRNGVEDRIACVRGDLLEPLRSCEAGDAPAAVVSNPPYIRPEEREALMPEVRDWEPSEALFDTAGNLASRIASGAARVLAPGGALVLEVGAGRAAEVVDLLSVPGVWEDVEVVEDYAGMPRVVHARRGGADEGR